MPGSRKKILWLCSWYPNKLEPFNGDFIQRHGEAAALYNDIYVIHVAADSGGTFRRKETEITGTDTLMEERIYYPVSGGLFGKLSGHYRLLHLYRQAIRRYVRKHGKPDAVHVQVPLKAGLFGIWIKRKYGIPYALTEHWGIYNEVAEDNYTTRSRVFRHYTREVFRHAAAFVSVSRYLAEGVKAMVINRSYQVIPNCVNTDLFYYREHQNPVFRFIHVSNMVPLKNTEGIIRAFSRLPAGLKASLLLVGDTEPGIRKFAEGLSFEPGQVEFRGEVPYAQVAAEMRESDCLVLFSNIENSPCVIGEALCCGLPVISTRVGGIPELLDATNGLLVEPRDEDALTEAMHAMIRNKGKYPCREIATRAAETFSYTVTGLQHDKLYTALKALSR